MKNLIITDKERMLFFVIFISGFHVSLHSQKKEEWKSQEEKAIISYRNAEQKSQQLPKVQSAVNLARTQAIEMQRQITTLINEKRLLDERMNVALENLKKSQQLFSDTRAFTEKNMTEIMNAVMNAKKEARTNAEITRAQVLHTQVKTAFDQMQNILREIDRLLAAAESTNSQLRQ